MLILHWLENLLIFELILFKKLSFISRALEFKRTWRNNRLYENRWLKEEKPSLIALELPSIIYEVGCKVYLKTVKHMIIRPWCVIRNRISYQVCWYLPLEQQKKTSFSNSVKVEISYSTSLSWKYDQDRYCIDQIHCNWESSKSNPRHEKSSSKF